MNKHRTLKKALSLLLCAAIFAGLGLSGTTANAAGKKITAYNVGDIVEFGWYPQSEVTDENMIAALNRAAGVDSSNVAGSTSLVNGWTSYNYYSGTGNRNDGKMVAGDYMRYTDILLDSDLYRGVAFDSYRPTYTGGTSSDLSQQDDNGYNINTVYWFKYESIKWRVLDPVTGMVMSEAILDSQPFNNYCFYDGSEYYGDPGRTYFLNNYAESDIREWLNKDFYNTAFSVSQKNMIVTTELDNSAYINWEALLNPETSYDSATTKDKIYLISRSDVLNTSYGFASTTSTSATRAAKGSDYAKSQGLCVATTDEYALSESQWRLRTAGNWTYGTWPVTFYCSVDYFLSVDGSNSTYGIRPALNFNPKAEIAQCKVTDLENSDTNNQTLSDLLEWLESLSDKLKSFFRTIIEWLKSLLGIE